MPDLSPSDSAPFELVTVAAFYNHGLAQLARARLEGEGFHAFLIDEQMGTINPYNLAATGGIRLQVPLYEVPAASALLDQLRRELQSDPEPLDEETLTRLALESDDEFAEEDALAAEAAMAAADAENAPRCPRCGKTDFTAEPVRAGSETFPRLLGSLILGADLGRSDPPNRFTCRACGHGWTN